MKLKDVHIIFFLGIGGIGMSSLARYFKAGDCTISGYDRNPSPLTNELGDEGMEIIFDDNPDLILNPPEIIIYTPAIPTDNKIYNHFKKMGIPMYKRAEILGMITEGKTTIAVAGTHGKTTISSIIAHILHSAGKDMTALIGGICKNYQSNFITQGDGHLMVVEADEYDRSFLHLKPDVAVVSSMDADHLDIYDNKSELEKNFESFLEGIKPKGKALIWHEIDPEIPEKVLRIDYSVNVPADVFAVDIRPHPKGQMFSLIACEYRLFDILFQMPGKHNIANATAASSVCFNLGLGPDEVRQGLESYTGVLRRFDYRINNENFVFIDDYAHHPNELKATIEATRNLYPGKKITGIFQPHLFSRTRDFAADFAKSLELLDTIILLDIYPAREAPIEGVSSELILKMIQNSDKHLLHKEEVLDFLAEHSTDVLLTLGAGDIDQLLIPIENKISALNR